MSKMVHRRDFHGSKTIETTPKKWGNTVQYINATERENE